jgi:hypothetical protein
MFAAIHTAVNSHFNWSAHPSSSAGFKKNRAAALARVALLAPINGRTSCSCCDQSN